MRLIAALLPGLLACSSSMDDCPNEDCIPPGTDYTYAVDRIDLEAEGLNLDGDPQNLPDNELGRFLEAISFRAPELDVQAWIDEYNDLQKE